jgi:hypothetical protein
LSSPVTSSDLVVAVHSRALSLRGLVHAVILGGNLSSMIYSAASSAPAEHPATASMTAYNRDTGTLKRDPVSTPLPLQKHGSKWIVRSQRPESGISRSAGSWLGLSAVKRTEHPETASMTAYNSDTGILNRDLVSTLAAAKTQLETACTNPPNHRPRKHSKTGHVTACKSDQSRSGIWPCQQTTPVKKPARKESARNNAMHNLESSRANQLTLNSLQTYVS